MDFMKVFDQTVREIKREVNLKVLKIPEIEQKVLDATDDEPWGPHGTVLAEIAQATKKYTECQMIMNVLWTRLEETGKNWRLVYKALAVIEYLVGHGSERSVDDIIEHTFQISALTNFEYVEPSGKDVGLNVRKKAENIVALLNDKEKIQEVRSKASANRDKYVGLSSTGLSYRSSATSFGSSGFNNSERYGGMSNTRDSNFGDNETDSYGDYIKNRQKRTNDGREIDSSAHLERKSEGVKLQSSSVTFNKSEPLSSNEDDFDDFDPRGTSSKATSVPSNQVDLGGENLLVDLMDAPTSLGTDITSTNGNSSDVDLFADAVFVSSPMTQATPDSASHNQTADLFGDHPAAKPSVQPSTIDFFSSDILSQGNSSTVKSEVSSTVASDPFASLPMSNAGSDFFDAFSSGPNVTSSEPTQNSTNSGIPSFTSSSTSSKEKFQVKSGIWADSLSRGLIDLNISAPKKVSLVDVGVVGDLNDGLAQSNTTRAMGVGSGLGRSGGFMSSAPSQVQQTQEDDFFSSLGTSAYQFGEFQK